MSSRTRRRRIRRVTVVTGTRAEYGLLRSSLEAIRAQPTLKLHIVAAGMHLLRKFGHTVKTIERDGFCVDARVPMQRGSDDSLDQAMGLSRGVAGVAKFLETSRTDIVLVLGDRIEALAGALAAVTTGRFVAHIHGGDIAPGDFDDSLRHSITKLAHLHFPATSQAARRLVRMGESKERVHCVGAPGLDRLIELVHERPREEHRGGGAVVVQHPCGRSCARERAVMSALLRGVEATGLGRTIIYPNSDRGHDGIIRAIESHKHRAVNGAVRVHRTLDRDAYLRLLIDAEVLVGNSSSGIIEACVAGTPSVNVGSRQAGRLRSGRGVIDAEESTPSICAALKRALARRPIMTKRTPYGDGSTGVRIAEALVKMPLIEVFRRKTNAY